MINFSIFIFIIYAVYESAANIVFGSGRKNTAGTEGAGLTPLRQSTKGHSKQFYTPPKKRTHKSAEAEKLRAYFFITALWLRSPENRAP